MRTKDTPEAIAWGGRLPEVQTLGELLAKPLPPKTPRIAPWLHAGESCLLWGGTGTGKSMVAMTLALGVAGGGSVMGWEFPNPCPVLWVDGEQSERDLQLRFRDLTATITGHDPRQAARNLRVMPRSAQGVTAGNFLDIANTGQAEAILAAVRKNSVGLVIFDNLSTLTDTVTEENQAAEWKPMQALLARLKGENVACIAVHHAGKLGDTYRGSSNIATTFERILALMKPATADASTLTVVVKVEKFRDKAPEGFRPEFPAALKEDASGRQYWETHDNSPLRKAWMMFRDGEGGFTTLAEFVAHASAQFGTGSDPSNFSRQYAHPWRDRLGIAPEDIERAKQDTKDRAADKDGSGDAAGF